VRNYHKLDQGQPLEDCIVCHFEIGYLELHVFGVVVFSGLECHRESDLPDWGCCGTRYYSMEGSPTWL
jgi:hypothetical protein